MKHRFVIASLLATVALMSAVQAEDKPKFVDLFNGKNLEGFTQRNGTATYRIEDNCIVEIGRAHV